MQALTASQGESSDGTPKEGLRPALYRTIQPPLNDMNFRSICANTETRVLFAHIRAASGGAIATVNNHPFVFGRHGKFVPIPYRQISDSNFCLFQRSRHCNLYATI